MVKRVFGKVDGIEVNYDHSKGDWWNVPVPLDIDGEYVIEVIAEDEAGNQSFITRLLYTVKGENICVIVSKSHCCKWKSKDFCNDCYA